MSKSRRTPPSVKAVLSARQQHEAAGHVIVVDQVSKQWGDRGVKNVSFAIHPGEFVFVTGPTGQGKAQPLDANILTPTGWVQMGNVKMGDPIIGGDGKICQVTGVYPQGKQPVYKVIFSDGTFTRCSKDHLWRVRSKRDKNEGRGWCIKPLCELTANKNNSWYVPVMPEAEFSANELTMDPYLLGLILGAGELTGSRLKFVSADTEIVEAVKYLLPPGDRLNSISSSDQQSYNYTISKGESNHVTQALQELRLTGKKSEDKFVPKDYLFSSVENRLSLLQALCDTNGASGLKGRVEFTSSSPQLADDLAFLARSLGGIARVDSLQKSFLIQGERKLGYPSFQVSFTLPQKFTAFRLKSKLETAPSPSQYQKEKSIISIELDSLEEVQCIRVGNPDSLYVTDDFIVTHNTTLLRLIQGKYLPDHGSISIGGLFLKQLDSTAYRRKIGFVSQTVDAIERMTVAENIAYPLQTLRRDPRQIQKRVQELLEVFGLQHAHNRLCDDQQLSGGERQRMAIARAIAHEPDLLLCDEPTGNLDEHTTYGVLKTLNQVAMIGTTVLCVTHDPTIVDLMRKRVIVIRDGQVALDQTGGYQL
jgi:ABC-type ATPase involved in cell division